MEAVFTEKAPKPVGPYSQAVKVGNFVFVSGQIPLKDSKIPENFEERVRTVIENVREILKAVNLDLNDVVKVTVYLTDLSKFDEFNKIYSEYFKEWKPARAVVEVSRLPKGVDIEMEVVAFAKDT